MQIELDSVLNSRFGNQRKSSNNSNSEGSLSTSQWSDGAETRPCTEPIVVLSRTVNGCVLECACVRRSCWRPSSVYCCLRSDISLKFQMMKKAEKSHGRELATAAAKNVRGDEVCHFKQICWVIWALQKKKWKILYRSKVISWVSYKVSISLSYITVSPSVSFKVISLANHHPCLHPPLPLRSSLLSIPQLGHYLKRPLLEISCERWGLTFKWCCHSWANFSATLTPDNCDRDDSIKAK